MDYKALEDLVNILVRKTGLELNEKQENKERKELEDKVNEITSKILLLEKTKEKEELESLTNEKEIILSALNESIDCAVAYAKKILSAFNEKKPYSYIKNTVESLVKLAKDEYEETHKKIEDTNIFTEMDNYNKLINSASNEMITKNYKNDVSKNIAIFASAYHKSKLKSLKDRKAFIPSQIEAINKIINELQKMCEILKKSRYNYMEELNKQKSKFYSNLLKFFYKDNLDEIKNIIEYIENMIHENKVLENSYIKDINKYKEEIANKEKNLIDINEEIKIEEDNIYSGDVKDNIDLLNDKLELLKNKSKLDSLSRQQQYLYVDPDVIREEIELLWNKKIKPEDEFEGVEIF